jgi:hypothetical protein
MVGTALAVLGDKCASRVPACSQVSGPREAVQRCLGVRSFASVAEPTGIHGGTKAREIEFEEGIRASSGDLPYRSIPRPEIPPKSE